MSRSGSQIACLLSFRVADPAAGPDAVRPPSSPGDRQLEEKIVTHLVRSLYSSQYAELHKALAARGALPTKCVLIKRSQDGRMQVGSKKVHPHMFFCRLWRFPQLQHSNQLRGTCLLSFYAKKSHVCVNPYHYEKISLTSNSGSDQLVSGTPPVGSEQQQHSVSHSPSPALPLSNPPTMSNPPSASLPFSYHSTTPDTPRVSQGTFGSSSASALPELQQQQQQQENVFFSLPPTSGPSQLQQQHQGYRSHSTSSLTSISSGETVIGSTPPGSVGFSPAPPSSVPTSLADNTSSMTVVDDFEFMDADSPSLHQGVLDEPFASPYHAELMPIDNSGVPRDMDSGSLASGPRTPFSPTNDVNNIIQPQANNGAFQAAYDTQQEDQSGPPQHSVEVRYQQQPAALGHPSQLHPPAGFTELRYVEPPFWCCIKYYEFSNRVGEVSYVNRSQFTVDGGTDPSCGDRFCLGSLSNVNRTKLSTQIRSFIGKGIGLYRIKESGEVYVQNHGEQNIFIQSQSCNLRNNFHPGTVCKVPPGMNLKVFNMDEFVRYLDHQLRRNGSFRQIFGLTSLCNIRLSFVKGWGQEYPRKRVTEVPCWIEISLNGPSQFIDKVLSTINPCSEPCDSK